jgi:CubicO group peptidase (beta-lactamase class C family)
MKTQLDLPDIASARTIERRPPHVGGRLRRRKPLRGTSDSLRIDSSLPAPDMRFATPLAAALLAVPTLPAQTPRTLPADFDAEVTTAMRQFEVPGLAIAVVKDGRMVFAKGYGVRRLGDPTPVDALTLFQIASNTKAFTTAALSMLVDEGKLRWDDPVVKHLPWFQLSDPYITRELTVRDLLTHRSGLGLGAGDLLWYHSDYSRDEILRRIRYAKMATSFRSAYAYDNVLYVAAGELIPAITGVPWDRFIRDRILTPLGMTGVATSVAAFAPGANFAAPHARITGRVQVVPRDTADVTAAAGGLVANVTDLSRWMIAQLDSGRVAGRTAPLFTPQRTRDMWTGVTVLPIGTPPKDLAALQPNFSEYGLGWFIRDYRGRKLLTHTGGLAGMVSRTLLVPGERLGIVILTNAETGINTALPWRALDIMLGAPRTDWATLLSAEEKRAEGAAAEVERKALGSRNTSSRPSLPLASYTGRYTDQMYGDATITMEGDKPVLRFLPARAFVGDLEHWQYDTFVAHWRTPGLPDAYVTFALTPQGTIDSMKLVPVSPLADFSFDYQDLLFTPVAQAR